MDRLLARLERHLGRFAIPNLIVYVVAGMAIVLLLSMGRPTTTGRLTLDMAAVRAGEPWRLVTFLFIPMGSTYWAFLSLYFTWWVGSSLEQHWGSFRFNAYYFVGALGAIVGALIAGAGSNAWLDASLLLAFATTFPDQTILLFFVLPLRMKWLGIVTAIFMGFALLRGSWVDRASVIASLAGYILFFGDHWLRAWRQRGILVRQKARREELRGAPAPLFGQRICALCGAREREGADIRVCACGKCGGKPRSLCLEHARNH